MNNLLFCMMTAGKLVTLGVMENKSEIHITPTFKSGLKSRISCAVRKKWRSAISQRNMGTICNESDPYFCDEFKFRAGLVALKQNKRSILAEIFWM